MGALALRIVTSLLRENQMDELRQRAREKLNAMSTSQLIELIVDYKIWAASGEASWAPCTSFEREVAAVLLDERLPQK